MKASGRRVLAFGLAGLLAASSAAADGYDRVAGKIADAAQGLKRRRIAVLRFPYVDNRDDPGSRLVQEQLMTRLVAYPALEVVERAAMGQMVEEITLAYKGLLDQRASYQLGRILDVDAVLTGTLVELPNRQIQLNARLIRIPDGLIVAAVEGLIKKTWRDASSPPDSPSLEKWLGNIFSPASNDFHNEEEISAFIREQFEALNSAAPAPRAAADSQIDSLIHDASAEGTSKKLMRGRWLYEQNCTYCHGPQGKGSRAMAETFGLSAARLDLSLKSLERYSAKDLASRLKNGESRMPAYPKPLNEEDASALLQYLRRLRKAAP
ncbi:MAG: c-type cytochrome [Elusimicrobia bacterium]|nr:c-type cytochrome [Elusimicrobiota bacterium]